MPPRIRRRITSARREQIEEEQRRLEKSIVRPFDVLNGLPVSYNPPPIGHYEDMLKNPLTMKDSGVFYRSLLKSRYNYVQICPMFRLYWIKQNSYAKKLASIEKPKKDEPSLLANNRLPVLGLDVSARDVMVKLCDASMTLGPHDFEIRLFIVKDERSEKPRRDTPSNVNNFPPQPSLIPTNPPQNRPVVNQSQPMNNTPPGQIQNLPSTMNRPTEMTRPIQNAPVPASPATNPQVARPIPSVPSAPPGPSAPQPPPAPPRPQPHPDPHNMQSIENTIMISNLNTIARTDESLNQLMKEVALGKAEQKQIITFQGYIKKAREMGPQPHHAYLFANHTPYKYGRVAKPPKERKPRELLPRNQKLTAFQERYTQDATLLFEFVENSNVRFMLPKTAICEILPPTTMTNAEEGDNSDNHDILVSFIWVHNQKEVDIYEVKLAKYEAAIKEREDEAKRLDDLKKAEEADRLGTSANSDEPSQVENDATLINKDTKDTEMKDENDEQDEEDQNEDEEVEEDQNESTQPEENEGEVTKESSQITELATIEEVDTENKPEDTTETQTETPVASNPVPPKKAKKKGFPPRKTGKKLIRPVQPEMRFTSVSFTIHGVPSKFVPIVANSFEPSEKAKQKMKHILDTGFRTSSFYLWYQIDGKSDERLAESIRTQLVQDEKRLCGATVSKEAAKKRVKKGKPDTPVKKVKVEEGTKVSDPVQPGNNTPLTNSSQSNLPPNSSQSIAQPGSQPVSQAAPQPTSSQSIPPTSV